MRPAAAATVVFLAAAAVLVLEILTARLMAPYLGVSLDTYTGIIGTVLAGISAGSWLGGRAADRYSARLLLGPILVLGGFLALISPTLVNALGPQVGGRHQGDRRPRRLHGVPPALVLSAVTPVVVKLQLTDLEATGTVVGRLSAFATAGALLGTFGTGFFLVAHAPTRIIVGATGVLLMVLGVLVAGGWLGRGDSASTIVSGRRARRGRGRRGARRDGAVRVRERLLLHPRDRRPAGQLRPDAHARRPSCIRTSISQDPQRCEFSYAAISMSAIEAIAPGRGAVSALQIGGGGFTMPRYLAGHATRVEDRRPGARPGRGRHRAPGPRSSHQPEPARRRRRRAAARAQEAPQAATTSSSATRSPADRCRGT